MVSHLVDPGLLKVKFCREDKHANQTDSTARQAGAHVRWVQKKPRLPGDRLHEANLSPRQKKFPFGIPEHLV